MNDTQLLQRQFIFQKNDEQIILEDPNDNLPANTVKSIYANQYPELLNAKLIDKGIVDNKITYEFQTIAGTKA